MALLTDPESESRRLAASLERLPAERRRHLCSDDCLRRPGAGRSVPLLGGGGGMKGHPAAQSLATARAQAHGLLADFGLTPRARAAVDQAPDAEDDADPAAEFFR